MKETIEKLKAIRAELESIKEPTGWINTAIGGIRTAEDQLGYHVDHVPRGTPETATETKTG